MDFLLPRHISSRICVLDHNIMSKQNSTVEICPKIIELSNFFDGIILSSKYDSIGIVLKKTL